MLDLHPVLRQRGFTIKAPPLREFVSEFSKLLSYGELSMVCFGPPRCGKSTASAFLRNRLEETGQAVVLWAHIERDVRQKKGTDRLWQDLCRGQNDALDPLINRPYYTLVNRTRVLADKLGTPKVLIALDEGQNLTDELYFALKKLVDDLIEYGLSPFVLQMAQPEILSRAERLKHRLFHDLVDRFLTRMYRFRGLRLDEFDEVLRHYDNACWPEGSSTSYVAHFAPNLWRAGWRMEQQVPAFVAAFTALATELGKDSSDIGMKFVTTAVRGLLNALAQNEAASETIQPLVHDCVRSCGYIEAARQVGDAEHAARKYRAPTKVRAVG